MLHNYKPFPLTLSQILSESPHKNWACRGCRFYLGARMYSIPCRASYFSLDDLNYWMIWKKWMNSSNQIKIVLCKFLAWLGIEYIFPPKRRDDLCLFFCLYPSSMFVCLARKPGIYWTVASAPSAPSMTGFILCQDSDYFLGQCNEHFLYNHEIWSCKWVGLEN